MQVQALSKSHSGVSQITVEGRLFLETHSENCKEGKCYYILTRTAEEMRKISIVTLTDPAAERLEGAEEAGQLGMLSKTDAPLFRATGSQVVFPYPLAADIGKQHVLFTRKIELVE